MLFDKNDDLRNERVLYHIKPNILFGCKKAIYGAILLAIVLMFSPKAIKFVGDMQVYLISRINLPLTRYTAIAFFVIILIIIIFIIWQLVGWYSREYILTQSRIIVKYGVLSTKKNYMPYAAIQDINSSQSIIGKIFNVGSINLFSAYDNNQLELSAVSNPSEIEEVIFSNMVNYRTYNEPRPPQEDRFYGRNFKTNDNYHERNDYYDEFEPITPIGREKDNPPRREYEYYPNDFGYEEDSRKRYEYEPYNDQFHAENKSYESNLRREEPPIYDDGSYYGSDNRSFESGSRYDDYSSYDDRSYDGVNRSFESGSRYEGYSPYDDGSYYDEPRDDYSYGGDKYYQNNDSRIHYEEDGKNNIQNESKDVDVDSSEKVIRRHFDKFKK